MNMYNIILKKREGKALTKEEIDFFIGGYTKGDIPDYQVSALLMAIYFQKMNHEETYNLTNAMKYSGEVIDLSPINGVKVDKHSTGGVGDKTTLIAAPIAAACGVPIAKMSGRGLGFTGGTIDKLESIAGFRTALSKDDFIDNVNKIGLSIISQTEELATADKKLYALRDVTATVENISLISSSIMSKKLALGSDAIVLDVKCGSGAFMKNFQDAYDLAKVMVDIGKADGKKTIALITNMDQPLGRAVGNSLEVIEALDTLKNQGPDDITQLALVLSGYMIYAGGKSATPHGGRDMALNALESGRALEKFKELIEVQGGDSKIIDDYSLFPQSSYIKEVYALSEGYINSIDTELIGMASLNVGAGRKRKEDAIDLSSGIVLNKKAGDYVEKGSQIATVYGSIKNIVDEVAKQLEKAFNIENSFKEPSKLILSVID
ncbi:MAG: pyrimidine-nucleoside phosphorylase [Clostridiales bacterium]|nr:pyrimidine-nucleoside phosphorylase [Clostridiales bacterium]